MNATMITLSLSLSLFLTRSHKKKKHFPIILCLGTYTHKKNIIQLNIHQSIGVSISEPYSICVLREAVKIKRTASVRLAQIEWKALQTHKQTHKHIHTNTNTLDPLPYLISGHQLPSYHHKNVWCRTPSHPSINQKWILVKYPTRIPYKQYNITCTPTSTHHKLKLRQQIRRHRRKPSSSPSPKITTTTTIKN